MGFIHESTAAAQGWTIETRRETFYLHDPHPYPATQFGIPTEPPSLVFASEDRQAWCFHIQHLPAVLECLRMCRAFLERQGMTYYAWRDGLHRESTVRLEGEIVRVEGDFREIRYTDTYRGGEPDMGGLELTYAELPRLERELIKVGEALPSDLGRA